MRSHELSRLLERDSQSVFSTKRKNQKNKIKITKIGKNVVTYCEVGIQASHGYFLAKYLGYDAAMYDGSYQEWSAKNMPVVKGDAKR